LIGVVVLLLLFAGDVIAATGVLPRLTVIVEAGDGPNALVQTSEIVLAPIVGSATELVEVLVDETPLIVQVVPAGIVDPPLTV
jgi:hypothetical protein